MFHDQHVFTHGMYLPFHFYALPRASYGYIWCGFIPSTVWRFSNIFFQLFRCTNLVLNRVFSYFLVVGMFFILGGCLDAPHICIPHTFICPIHSYAPRDVHTPICPHTPPCICIFSEALHVVGGCKGLPFMLGHFPYTTPVWGCLLFIYTPILSHWFPVHWYVSGISVCYVGIFPSVKGFGGVPGGVTPSVRGFRGHQHLRCPYSHSGTFFVVHYVSRFHYGSNYYSSGYNGIFWPVISVVSHSGSFPDRVF